MKIGGILPVSLSKTLCIAAGGPSLADTIKDRKGDLVAVNGSHDWLIERGIMPLALGLMDYRPRLATMFTPHRDVRYYVASSVDQAVMKKLAGFDVVRWDYEKIRGGCSMGLRWLTLGYLMGYRNFALHGFDSSFREGRTHAYPHYRDEKHKGKFKVDGFETADRWVAQIIDFFKITDELKSVKITVHGDGLLQRRFKENNRLFEPEIVAAANACRRAPSQKGT